MVLNKILDQYLSSYQIQTKCIKGFGNNEVLKTLNVKLFMDADANANANASGSTTALRELCSGELKIDGRLVFLSEHHHYMGNKFCIYE